MEGVRTFLESSTIHGLGYIPATRKLVKLFWMAVVITGFTCASIMIYQSFKDWQDNPVTTTIDTSPIKEMTFPQVTVCPPKNTFTDLNYDLMMTENITLDHDKRTELTNYAIELLYDQLFDMIMANLSKLEDNNRYYNWYHGFTEIKLPYYQLKGSWYYYEVNTFSTTGTIKTKFFGDKFDADKVEKRILYKINVYSNDINNHNVTLHFEIDDISMTDLSTGDDKFIYTELKNKNKLESLEAGISHIFKNYTPPGRPAMEHTRDVIFEDVKKQYLDLMPGIKVAWYYSGKKVTEHPYYSDNVLTKCFVRNCFTIYSCQIHILCHIFLGDERGCKITRDMFVVTLVGYVESFPFLLIMLVETTCRRFANILKLTQIKIENIWKLVRLIKLETSLGKSCGTDGKIDGLYTRGFEDER